MGLARDRGDDRQPVLVAVRTAVQALSVAFTLSGAIQALVPLGSWIFLGESIPIMRWMGILLVIAGVVISAKPATVVEEKL